MKRRAKEERMAKQEQKKQDAKRKAEEKIFRKQHVSEKKPTDYENKAICSTIH